MENIFSKLKRISKIDPVIAISLFGSEKIETYRTCLCMYEILIRQLENSVLNEQYKSVEDKITMLDAYLSTDTR